MHQYVMSTRIGIYYILTGDQLVIYVADMGTLHEENSQLFPVTSHPIKRAKLWLDNDTSTIFKTDKEGIAIVPVTFSYPSQHILHAKKKKDYSRIHLDSVNRKPTEDLWYVGYYRRICDGKVHFG